MWGGFFIRDSSKKRVVPAVAPAAASPIHAASRRPTKLATLPLPKPIVDGGCAIPLPFSAAEDLV